MLILPYQKSWTEDFYRIKEVISSTLDTLNITIEHIGSTAVPGLAAKPIIDIDLVYSLPGDFEVIKRGLEKLGYYHNGNQGIPHREVFKRRNNNFSHEVLDGIDHHLYVCFMDSPELKRHIAFRDYLQDNESARKKYEDLKLAIAKMANQDRKLYAQLKEKMARGFIEDILIKANR